MIRGGATSGCLEELQPQRHNLVSQQLMSKVNANKTSALLDNIVRRILSSSKAKVLLALTFDLSCLLTKLWHCGWSSSRSHHPYK